MITTCTVCQARYQLDAEKIPPRVIKVRCPACSGVFSLDGTAIPREAPLAVAPPDPVAPAPQPVAPPPAASVPTPKPSAPVAAPSDPAPAAAVAATGPSVAVMDAPEPTPKTTGGRRRRGKEEMLARALVSDIKVYNRELYDNAKAEGNLLEALGAEIKKSWELYKEKVTPEVANSSDHFRNALNEILADGEKVF